MKKKTLIYITLLPMLLSGCDKKHEHSVSEGFEHDESYHWHTCSGCDEKFDTVAHDIEETIVKQASCTEQGSKKLKCKVCNYEQTVAIDKLDHTYSDIWSKNSTHHWHACSGCDEKSNYAEHDFDNGTIITDADFDKEGCIKYVCETCSYELEIVIPKKRHTYEEGYHSDDNNHWHQCTDVGYETAIDGLEAHNFSCASTSDSQHKFSCKCGKESISNHNFVINEDGVTATCTDCKTTAPYLIVDVTLKPLVEGQEACEIESINSNISFEEFGVKPLIASVHVKDDLYTSEPTSSFHCKVKDGSAGKTISSYYFYISYNTVTKAIRDQYNKVNQTLNIEVKINGYSTYQKSGMGINDDFGFCFSTANYTPSQTITDVVLDNPVINFSKMTTDKAKEFFSVKNGKVVTENIDLAFSISDGTMPDGVIEVMSYGLIISRDNSYYKFEDYSRMVKAIPYESAIAFAEKVYGNSSLTEENVREFYESIAEEQSTECVFADEYICLTMYSNVETEYYIVYPDEVYYDKYVFDIDDYHYYVERDFNSDLLEDSTLYLMHEFKDFITYDEENDCYNIDPTKIGDDSSEYSELSFIVDENRQIQSLVGSGTTAMGVNSGIFELDITVTDLTENIVLPEAEKCDHEDISEDYDQDLYAPTGEYYHYKYCNSCYSSLNIEKCTFNEDGYCTICEIKPTYSKCVYQTPSDCEDEFLVFLEVNAGNNTIDYSYIYTEISKTIYDYENCTFETLTIEETDAPYVNWYKGKETNYIVINAYAGNDHMKAYYIVGATVVEDDGHLTISGGNVLSYLEGSQITIN